MMIGLAAVPLLSSLRAIQWVLRVVWVHRLMFVWLVYSGLCLFWGLTACVFLIAMDFNKLPANTQRRYKAFKTILNKKRFSPIVIVLASAVLLPIRLLLVVFVALSTFVMFNIAHLVLPAAYPEDPLEPHCKGTRVYQGYHSTTTRVLHAIMGCCCNMLLVLFGVVRIREHFPGKEYRLNPNNLITVVSNHVSALDPLYFAQKIFPSFVVDVSIAKNMILRQICQATSCHIIDREDLDNRRSVLHKIKQHQSILAKQLAGLTDANDTALPPLLFFPEGTASNGRQLMPLKRGAFFSLQPVTPAVVIYRCPCFHLFMGTLGLSIWLPLVLSSPYPVTMDIYWMETQYPPIAVDPASGDALSLEEQLPAFVEAVQQKMGACIRRNLTSEERLELETAPQSDELTESLGARKMKIRLKAELHRIGVREMANMMGD